MRTTDAWLRCGLLVLVILATACGDRSEREGTEQPRAAGAEDPEPIDSVWADSLPAGTTLQMAALGRAVFRSSCTPCHGPAGEGTQLGPSLRDSVWIHSTGEFQDLVRIIQAGVAKPEEYPIPMPALAAGDSGEDPALAVAAYTHLLGHGAR